MIGKKGQGRMKKNKKNLEKSGPPRESTYRGGWGAKYPVYAITT